MPEVVLRHLNRGEDAIGCAGHMNVTNGILHIHSFLVERNDISNLHVILRSC